MRRFDVYRNDNVATQKRVPFFVILQSELLSDLLTVVVAPIAKLSVVEGRATAMLMPKVSVEDREYLIYIPELAAVHARSLRKRVASLESERDAITRALDLLFSGI